MVGLAIVGQSPSKLPQRLHRAVKGRVAYVRLPLEHRKRTRSTDESVKGARSSRVDLGVLVVERGDCERGSFAGRDAGETGHGRGLLRSVGATTARGVIVAVRERCSLREVLFRGLVGWSYACGW